MGRCGRGALADRRGSFDCYVLAGFCSLWLLGILAFRLTGPFVGDRYVLFLIMGSGLLGFSFLTAIRCRMSF